jgi:diamine N-acetyltransferase
MTNNSLTGKNVMLRALEPDDVDLLYAWENDTTIWNVSNTLAPFSRFQIEEFVLNGQHDIFSTKQLRLMIDLVGSTLTEKSVGTIDLFDFDPVHFRAGVGVLIREQYRQRGYGLQAMNLLIHYAFGTLRLHQMYCNIAPDNLSSLGLFEQLGFARCGIKKDWVREGKGWQEEWMFQLISPDE